MTITPHERMGIAAAGAAIVLIAVLWLVYHHFGWSNASPVVSVPAHSAQASAPASSSQSASAAPSLNPIQGVYTNPF